jgi:uncharacterized membrane protein/protein-disulfide isomerase
MGLSALALTASVYLSWHSLAGGSLIGCGGVRSCDEVLTSGWSTIAGVLPVSGLSAGTFLAILIANLHIGPATAAPDRRLAWSAMLLLVGAAAGSAVWFTIVQKWLVGALCPYCMAIHGSSLLLAALVVWQAPKHLDVDITDKLTMAPTPQTDAAVPEPIRHSSQAALSGILRRWQPLGLVLVGLALAGALAACQIAFPGPSIAQAGNSPETLPAADPGAIPLIGSPDALYVVTVLFDYQCPHCQQLHFMLEAATRRYDGKLAFALSPAPLNRRCNPYVPRDVEEFQDSCELAKVALAVWLASREAFPAFQRWMFSFESGNRWQPRSLESARAKAIELVGKAKLDAAWSDPWIDKYLQSSIQLYGRTTANAVPKLVFGSRWVIPKPNDLDDLVLILQDSLALPRL